MATQAELVADLKAVNAQQVKTLGEIQTLQKSSDALAAKIRRMIESDTPAKTG